MQSHNFVCLKIYSFGLLQKPYVKWPFSRNGYIVQMLWHFFFFMIQTYAQLNGSDFSCGTCTFRNWFDLYFDYFRWIIF